MSPSSKAEQFTDTATLRQCLGRFATGVTVVTCRDAHDRPCGITANSFSSVSLEPPLVLWNIAKVSNSLQAFLNADCFAINVLRHEQRELAAHFAKSEHTLFDGVDIENSADQVPLLPATLACFECRTWQVHDAGDHYIIIGEILRLRQADGEPLLFYGGRYAALADG